MLRRIWNSACHLWGDESGPTAVEYAIMLALIVVMCLGAVLTTGSVQRSLWLDTANTIHGAVNN